MLEKIVEKIKNLKLIVVDTFAEHFRATDVGYNDASVCLEILNLNNNIVHGFNLVSNNNNINRIIYFLSVFGFKHQEHQEHHLLFNVF